MRWLLLVVQKMVAGGCNNCTCDLVSACVMAQKTHVPLLASPPPFGGTAVLLNDMYLDLIARIATCAEYPTI